MDFKQSIASVLSKFAGQSADELHTWLETPPSPEMGDYAFPCFKLAKALKKASPVIAQELAGAFVLPRGFSRAIAASGYVNFYLDKAAQAKAVLERVFAEGERYGGSDMGAGATFACLFTAEEILDYSYGSFTDRLANPIKR